MTRQGDTGNRGATEWKVANNEKNCRELEARALMAII